MLGIRWAWRCSGTLFPLGGRCRLVIRSTLVEKGKTSRPLVAFGRFGDSDGARTDEKGNDEGERQTTHFQKDLLSKMGYRGRLKRPAPREEIEVFADRFYARRALPMEM